jgi:hypothetical protein
VARDVEVNVTANDRTGNALAKVERGFSETARHVEAESDRMGDGIVSKVAGHAPRLTGVLVNAVGTAGQAGGPLLAGGIAVAGPLIASTMAGAIIGGAGIGGVVGGLAVVSKDARVASAFKGLGDDLGDRLEGAAGSFVGPALEGVRIVDDALGTVDFERIFAASSRYVLPLAEGVGRAITGLGDGIEDLIDNAGPVIDVIADGIGDIGEAIGEGMSSLADNGEAAADSLDEVFSAIELVTDATFGLINGLMEGKEFLDDFAGGVFAFDSGLRLLNAAFGDGEDETRNYNSAVDEGTQGLEQFRKAAKEANDELRAQVDPVFALLDAQEDLRESNEAYDEAVKRHGKNSREARQALRDQAVAALDLQGAVGELGEEFDGHLTPAMRNTLRAAGFTKGEINGVEREFQRARRAGEKFDDRYTARVSMDNYRDVNGKLNGLLRDLENFDGRWTATMVTNYERHGKPGTGGGLATGGVAEAGQSYVVGENGPEILQMGNRHGAVIPNHALGDAGGGDLYLTVDLGEGITQRLRIERRNLKRQAAAA